MKAHKFRGRPCCRFGLWLVVLAAVAVLAARPCGAFVSLASPACAKGQTTSCPTSSSCTAPSLMFMSPPNNNNDETEPIAQQEKEGASDDETINEPDEVEDEDDDALSSSPQVFSSSRTTTPEMKLPSRWKLIVAYLAFISFWPLLAAVQVYLRTHEFDIDTYLTVKGLLDTAAPPTFDDGSSSSDTTIMELPPLSPAERLVDSLFGPNKSMMDPTRGGF